MNTTITWKNLVGQERTKETLGNAFSHGTLGHAYLFCGDEGTGKFQAALELSMALLCQDKSTVPCYACESCAKILRNAHQDFHGIAPVYLDKEHKSSDGKLNPDGWNYLSQRILEKITNPYALDQFEGVANIPVEWVKEVNHTILRGALSIGKNITVISDVDVMNKESANAMLKTLEEPPPNTLMILTSNRPQSVLPTIISRCQIVRFGAVSSENISEALVGRFGFSASLEVTEAVRLSQGSPGKAILYCENAMGELAEEARKLLSMCIAKDWQGIAVYVDEIARQGNLDRNEKLLMRLVHGVRNRFLATLPISATYIDSQDFARTEAVGSFPLSDIGSIEQLLKACQEATSALRGYGNISLVLVNFILTVMEIIHGKQQ